MKLPHERDEDTDMTDDQPDPKILQAYKDLKQGQVDTDMRATPGQDAAKRGLSGIDGGRQREVQHQMVDRDQTGIEQDRTPVAKHGRQGKSRKEHHVGVGLPGMATHQPDAAGRAGRCAGQ